MQGVHTKDRDIAGRKVAGQQAGTALSRKTHRILRQRRLARGVARHIEADHRVDQVAVAVGALHDHERPVGHRHVADRQPHREHLVVRTGKKRVVKMQPGGPATRSGTQEHVILRPRWPANQHGHEALHCAAMAQGSQLRAFADRLPECAAVRDQHVTQAGAGGDRRGRGRQDLADLDQPPKNLVACPSHQGRVQHTFEVHKTIGGETFTQCHRLVH